jgi:predicted nucleotidyltransferase
MLVEFSQAVGWEFFNLEEFLEQSLGIRVDLVTREALKERIKESILNQVRYI